jgi:hypothetical protein
VLFVALVMPARAQEPARPADPVDGLVARVASALERGDPDAYLALVSPLADRERAARFAREQILPGVTRAVARVRDRVPLEGALPGEGYRLIADVFVEMGDRARLATWRLDVRGARRAGAVAGEPASLVWRIADQELLNSVEGLYRLQIDPTTQFHARRLVVTSEDLELRLHEGAVFVARIDEGVTGLVLLGRGEMVFAPRPAAERGQIRILAGEETLRTGFSRAFIRLNPQEFATRLNGEALAPQAVDPDALEQARAVFEQFVGRSFSLDLSDLSRDTWSLIPSPGDFLAEIRTRRFATLTYARAFREAEDITLFDRARKKNIALYASEEKLAARGRYYNEDDLMEYDIVHYGLDVSFDPARQWIEGRAQVTLRVRAFALASLTMRLADSLAVSSLVSDELGRLLPLRVRGQDNLIVNLPGAVPRDTELTLRFAYAGRLEPQEVDREALAPQRGESFVQELPLVTPEARYLYSNRTYWYPQSTVSDYATATVRITVPGEYGCVASGRLVEQTVEPRTDGRTGTRRRFTFVAPLPVRYLSVVVTRLTAVAETPLALDQALADGTKELTVVSGPNTAVSGVVLQTMLLRVEAQPRQTGRARGLVDRAADIARFYTALVGDYPYPTFTLAVTESDLPGGHSPAYFAVLNQPLPTAPVVWRNDPVSFESYPLFFLAHELAHQWWGQAVGWENYHEQWLSEGFAQYFAALYARRDRGEALFTELLRQMRRWAMEYSREGPISLGYRLGHIRGQSRVFRALVYNKAALVLHMLRRLVGEAAFFRAVRRFYGEARFQKAGTDDLQRAFEAESGRSLDRFFEQWVHGTTLPRLRFSHRIEAPGEPPERSRPADGAPAPDRSAPLATVVLRFEQEGEVFEVPVTVTLTYSSGETRDVLVPVTDRIVELRVPLAGPLRRVDVNRDHAALATIRP